MTELKSCLKDFIGNKTILMMEMLLEVKADKVGLLTELLEHLPFVKIKAPGEAKEQVLQELEEAVENMKLVKAGKMQATPVEQLLNEL